MREGEGRDGKGVKEGRKEVQGRNEEAGRKFEDDGRWRKMDERR